MNYEKLKQREWLKARDMLPLDGGKLGKRKAGWEEWQRKNTKYKGKGDRDDHTADSRYTGKRPKYV